MYPQEQRSHVGGGTALGRSYVYRTVLAVVIALIGIRSTSAANVRQVRVTIIVDDALQLSGIAHTHVRFESNSQRYDGFTGSGGAVDMDLQPDLYVVTLSQPDYDFGNARYLSVSTAGSTFRFDGKRIRMRRIGATSARVARPNNRIAKHAEDAESNLLGSVLANPYVLPDLGISKGGSIRIGSQNASTTTAAIDDAPIFPSGSDIPAAIFSGDLFGEASIGDSTAASPGGILNVATFDPTIDWQTLGTYRPSSFGSDSWSLRERGTSGSTGLAFVHAEKRSSDPLNNEYFADASGLSYKHDSATNAVGNILKVRMPLSREQVLSASGGDLALRSPEECELIEGPTICGTGPFDSTSYSTWFGQLKDELTLSHATLRSQVFASKTSIYEDQSHSTFLNNLSPYTDASQTVRYGASMVGSYYLGRGEPTTLSLMATRDASSAAQTFQSAVLQPPPTVDYFWAKLTAPLFQGPHDVAHLTAGYNASSGDKKAMYGFDYVHHLKKSQTVELRASSGAVGSPTYGASGVSAVQDLRFDCNDQALGNGPSTGGKAPNVDNYGVRYDYDGGRVQTRFAYRMHVIHDGRVQGTVPGSAIDPLLFPSQYVTNASSAGSALCDVPQRILPSSLQFLIGGTAATVVDDGLDLGLTIAVGKRATVTASYVLDRARAFGLSGDLSDSRDLKSGYQLPSVPVNRINSAFSYGVSNAASLIGEFIGFGSNNIYARYPFAAVNLGARFKTPNGDIVLAVQNITNVASPQFSRFAPFPFVQQAFGARTFAVQMRLAVGNSYVDRAAVLNPPILPQDSSVISFSPVDFEASSPQAFLALNTSDPSCGPEMRTSAAGLLAAIRDFSTEVELQKRSGVITPAVKIGAVQLDAVPAHADTTIRISFNHDSRSLAPMLRCGRIHSGTYSAAEHLSLFIPDARTRYEDGPWVLYYTPHAGLYYAPEGDDATNKELVAKPSPTFPTRVSVANVTIDEAACPAAYRAAVSDTLKDLRKVLGSANEASAHRDALEQIRVRAHAAKGGEWYELAFDDVDLANAFARCLDIPAATDDQLKSFHIGGAGTLLSIDYSPSLGFFTYAQ